MMKFSKKLYCVTDGKEFVILPEQDMRKDSPLLKSMFGLSSVLDVKLMTQYNEEFRKEIAERHGIEPKTIQVEHVIRLATIQEVNEWLHKRNESFSFPVHVKEGVYQFVDTVGYQLIEETKVS